MDWLPHRSLAVVAFVAFAMLLRGLACWTLAGGLSEDPDAYAAIAVTVANTGTFGITAPDGEPHPTAFRPPLYPWLLSAAVEGDHLNRISVACLHALLGGLTVWLAIITSRQLIGGSGLVAGGLVAIDPILLTQSALVMTETLAATIAAAVLCWWSRQASAGRGAHGVRFGTVLGVLLALAYLCRPTFLVWGVLLCGASLLLRGSSLSRISAAFSMGLVLALTVAGWTARNQTHFGRAIWATSHGGYTLLLANNPLFYDFLSQRSFGEAWDAERFFMVWSHRYEGDVTTRAFWERPWTGMGVVPPAVSETSDDALAYQAAKATIRRNPAAFFRSCWVRLSWLWSPLPHHTEDRPAALIGAVGAFYVTVYTMCLVGIYRWGGGVFSRPWWAFWLLVFTLSGVHAVYWSNLRMRSPATTGIAVLAAASLRPRGVRDRVDSPSASVEPE